MAALLLWSVLLTGTVQVRADLSFDGIAAAHDVETSKALLPQRIARVLVYWSALARRGSTASPGFNKIAMAKLLAGREVSDINRALLDKAARPFARYGTRITIVPGLCARDGDYDFSAQELVRLSFTHLPQPLALWPETARKIAWTLLPEAGSRHYSTFRLGICGRHRDSENHILMTESSRYLTNQLRRRLGDRSVDHDNTKNGFDTWMLRHLSHFLRGHFEEYNARPYQGYTVEALENLHGFSASPQVQKSAELVLDYLSAVFAVQSNGLRRNAPFRRKARFAQTPFTHDHDTETPRFALLSGNYDYLSRFQGHVPYGEHFMLSAALGKYRVPEVLLDLIVRKDRGTYFQRLHHAGVELYASSPSFLVSAGGVFVHNFMFGSAEQHGWARATTIMPTRDTSTDTRGWLRVLGSREPAQINNTCVAPNFACGLNLEIPDSIPAACRERHGDFVFIDLSAPRCPLDLGFYVAARIERCSTKACRQQADNFGLFEVREASELPFASFRDKVLAHNHGQRLHSDGLSSYVTSQGRRFTFEVLAERTSWPIVSIDRQPQVRSFSRWPLAEGSLIRAAGDGLVTIDNPFRKERLVLDARDPLRPQRYVVNMEASRRPPPVVANATPTTR